MFLECNEIIPDRLWVGGWIQPDQIRALRTLGITTVMNLQSDQDISERGVPIKKLSKALAEANIAHLREPVPDFDKKILAARLPQCVAALETALQPRWAKVYLHCTAGINRGPTVAAAYLMKSHGMTPQAAFQFLIERRHCSPYLDLLEAYGAEGVPSAEIANPPRSSPE